MRVLGLLGLQLLLLGVGLVVLTALRRWSTWADVVRMLGVAYLLGVGTVGVASTLVLVAGFGIEAPNVVVLAVLTAGVSAGVARHRGHGLPRGGGFVRPQWSPGSAAGLAGASLVVAILVLFLRATYNQGLTAWDAWAFWVPKAKAIYFFGGLDEHLFRVLFAPSYPLFVPALEAMDFHFAGAADASIIALQYWLLFVGFVFAARALLRPLAPAFVIWPFLAIAALMPELDRRLTNGQADWPLDIFFTIAALALARWVVTREGWLLGVFGITLSTALGTKREGQLLAACLVAGALAATWPRLRTAWPQIIGVGLLAYLVHIPWRIWWMSRHLLPDTPPTGIGGLGHYSDRVAPAFRITLELLFRYDMWLLATPLAIAAAVLLLARGKVGLPAMYLITVTLAVVGFVWILWSYPWFPLDDSGKSPIPRAVGAVTLLSCVFAPLLLSGLLADESPILEPADLVPAKLADAATTPA